jgi:hypothetical protein
MRTMRINQVSQEELAVRAICPGATLKDPLDEDDLYFVSETEGSMTRIGEGITPADAWEDAYNNLGL